MGCYPRYGRFGQVLVIHLHVADVGDLEKLEEGQVDYGVEM